MTCDDSRGHHLSNQSSDRKHAHHAPFACTCGMVFRAQPSLHVPIFTGNTTSL